MPQRLVVQWADMLTTYWLYGEDNIDRSFFGMEHPLYETAEAFWKNVSNHFVILRPTSEHHWSIQVVMSFVLSRVLIGMQQNDAMSWTCPGRVLDMSRTSPLAVHFRDFLDIMFWDR